MRARWAILWALLTLAAVIGPAEAQVVGPTCTISWNAVTTNTDGTPVVGSVFYKVWIQTAATPVPVPGTTPLTLSATVASVPCPSGMTSGPKFVWVNAWTTAGESALSTSSTAVPPVAAVPLAFVYVGTPPPLPSPPAPPTGLKVAP